MKKQLFLFLFLVTLTLQGYSQNPDFYYSSPKQGAKYINTEQVILLKSKAEITTIEKSFIKLSGENGDIPTRLKIEDGNILFITPTEALKRNSTYHLDLKKGAVQFSDKESDAFTLTFSTGKGDNADLLQAYHQHENEMMLAQVSANRGVNTLQYNPGDNNNNYPDKFPKPIFKNINNPDPRPLFTDMSPLFTNKYNAHIMILDNYGIPIYFKKVPAIDFKVLPNGDLVYGFFNLFNASVQYYLTMDAHFKEKDTIRMGNGYHIDIHDIILLENDHYLTMAYDPQVVDMSEIVEGGNPEAVVTGLVIQEVDLERNVYFEWRSWDHMEITDASDAVDLTAENIDYVHANAFEFAADGNLMVSQRSMDEITKIDYETGDIIWRMGLLTKKNMFTFNDTIGWTHQHDIRLLPNGNITLFDNGNHHKPFPYSQAIEYSIDEQNMTATKVWGYIDNPPVFSFATGSNRRIADDRSLIGWGLGGWPNLACEISLNGEKHFDMLGPDSIFVYRSLKFDWDHDVFTFNKDTLDFGEYDDYVAVSRTFKVINQMDADTIRITSSHNHLSDFWSVTQFPISLAPGEETNIIVNFLPQGIGEFNDVLTLNYDNADTTERIARQIVLTGHTPTAINEYANDKVSIYPNPVSEYLNINTDFKGKKEISIYNISGQQVHEESTTDDTITITTGNLPAGVYTGFIKSDEGLASFKFVKK